ncbi:MAG: oxygen-independent coproporphyrinogen III oxidase [Rhizobiaceae bacterium]
MQPDLIRKMSAPVPRYTSYPTAPHFHPGVTADEYGRWLGALPEDASISLYLHIPYCDQLCWFCACHTKQTLKYEPLATYVDALIAEIGLVGARAAGRGRVTAVHYGGGSPTLLIPEDLKRIDRAMREAFRFDPAVEISVEIDPNDVKAEGYEALAAIGLTRASLGVQDFDPKVQQAINRIQPFERTREVIEAVRRHGARSVNIDLLYGLPHQTRDSVEATLRQVLTLRPDRIALFGYAHVPWMKKHQTMIDEAVLPEAVERFAQSNRAASLLAQAGYQAIGIDHFALPQDSLAVAARSGRMKRNFQGYTDDAPDALIGLGASSIGQLPQGYVQNMPATGEYQRIVGSGRLATVRGFALESDDRLRARVIERLMCDFAFEAGALRDEFGAGADDVIAEAGYLAENDAEQMFARDGDHFFITDKGRPFARSIAASFDSYFGSGTARHSMAV